MSLLNRPGNFLFSICQDLCIRPRKNGFNESGENLIGTRVVANALSRKLQERPSIEAALRADENEYHSQQHIKKERVCTEDKPTHNFP